MFTSFAAMTVGWMVWICLMEPGGWKPSVSCC